ncbi:MAG: hypothetical protein Unbinned1190contig1000_13 [Prokaryotic dsDNA virus sp.]|nr:MAG: hypothetical protein Unbinned1190contig1000_13 [Prokaryotic dsDNA virus sp.]|tara:strand:+ start:21140 stop:21370 length:231 start_codon:yes stop_codon:yes gene_type:complete
MTLQERVRAAFDWVPQDMVDTVFVACVKIMYYICGLTGISYEALNIWLFIIIQPALIALFFGLWVREKMRHNTIAV